MRNTHVEGTSTRLGFRAGVRYEDLARDPAYLFAALNANGLSCPPPFQEAAGHSKFGVETAKSHVDAAHAYAPVEWTALLGGLDVAFEATLGYAYGPVPGTATAGPPPPGTWLLFDG